MFKVSAFAGLAAMLPGCVMPAASWKGMVKWPETEQDEQSIRTVVPATEAAAALAAAAAIREMVRTNPFPRLFLGCSHPAQGMDVAVFTGPTPGLYYVVLGQRFDRCGGPSGRLLDWNYAYAVTPQGEVVEKAPPQRGEPPAASPPSPPPPEPVLPPATSPISPPATPPPQAPTAPPPSTPSPASPPTPSPASGTQEQEPTSRP